MEHEITSSAPETGRRHHLSLLQRFFGTPADAAMLILRLSLGVVMLAHGTQKMFGWFGGNGFTATLQYFEKNLSIPMWLGVVVIVTEFFGALALIAGLCTRLAALGIAVLLTVAAFMAHVKNGFFMDWQNSGKGEGYEFHILAVAMAVALLVRGAGLFSLDRLISRRRG